MTQSRRGISADSCITTDRAIEIGEGRALVVVRNPSGGGIVMLIQQDGAGRMTTSVTKVFRFSKRDPPNWRSSEAVQLILDTLGVTG